MTLDPSLDFFVVWKFESGRSTYSVLVNRQWVNGIQNLVSLQYQTEAPDVGSCLPREPKLKGAVMAGSGGARLLSSEWTCRQVESQRMLSPHPTTFHLTPFTDTLWWISQALDQNNWFKDGYATLESYSWDIALTIGTEVLFLCWP